MRKLVLVLISLTIGALVGRYGPTAASFLIIPPEHGYFRFYQIRDFRTGRPYWQYRMIDRSIVVSTSFRENRFDEEWEAVWFDGRREAYLYDDRNEFDGTMVLTRTEMILRTRDGNESRYPRVMDLWEIWLDKSEVEADRPSTQRLADRRQMHHDRIARRMKEQGIIGSPAVGAQQRPPRFPKKPNTQAAPGPRPLIAVTEFGAWNNTGTVFAAYEGGPVICLSAAPGTGKSYHIPAGTNADELVRDLVPSDFTLFAKEYRISDATDQLITRIWVDGYVVKIYGPWRALHLLSENANGEDIAVVRENNEYIRQRWASLPESIRNMLRKIDKLRANEGSTWLPETIEVIFSEYERARDQPIFWPKEWPGLYAETSRKNGSNYVVVLPSREHERLEAFLNARSEQSGVMIDLNQMYPRVHYPFPNEAVWLQAED